MGKLKRLITFCLIAISASCAFAKQISFQVVQHDQSADVVTEQSLVIEDEVLTSFFESGFIVTNSPAVISESDGQDAALFKTGIGEAFNGYSEYFVQINLFYERTEATTSKDADLQKIKFTIAKTNTGKTIANKSFDNIKIANVNTDLRKVSLSLVKEINKALNAYKA
ncbi:MAG: hypothetical protein K6C97_03855 [Treponema sp.]|nr:hypothetical protein [Treponema sp.]